MQPFETGKNTEGIPLMNNSNSNRPVSQTLLGISISMGLFASILMFASDSPLLRVFYFSVWFSALSAIFGFSLENVESLRSITMRLGSIARVGLIFSAFLLVFLVTVQPSMLFSRE